MCNIKISLFAFICFACSALFAFSASAKPTSTPFQDVMKAGIDYYKAGESDPENYNLAVQKFISAAQLSDNPLPYYNLARTYEQLHNCEQALSYYRTYESRSTKVRKYGVIDVTNNINKLNEACGMKQGEVVAACSQPDVMMRIDNDQPVPCGTVVAYPAMTHTVTFEHHDYLNASRSITIKPGMRTSLDVVLEKKGSSFIKVASEQTIAAAEIEDARKRANAALPDAYFEGDSLANHPFLWGGLGASVAGIALTITGCVLVNSSVKSSSNWKGGIAAYSIGGTLAVGGAVMMIYDAVDHKSREEERYKRIEDQLAVIPTIGIGPDGGSAGLILYF